MLLCQFGCPGCHPPRIGRIDRSIETALRMASQISLILREPPRSARREPFPEEPDSGTAVSSNKATKAVKIGVLDNGRPPSLGGTPARRCATELRADRLHKPEAPARHAATDKPSLALRACVAQLARGGRDHEPSGLASWRRRFRADAQASAAKRDQAAEASQSLLPRIDLSLVAQ